MNARRTMVLAMFAVIASAGACASSDTDLDQLAEQRAIWESQQISDYSIEAIGLTGTASVDRVFDELEDAVANGADIDVDYDDELGFPRWAIVAHDGSTHEIGVTYFEVDAQIGPEQGELRPIKPPRPTPEFEDIVGVEPAPDRPPGSIFTPIGQPRAPELSVVAP
jgi:hypothetical protein